MGARLAPKYILLPYMEPSGYSPVGALLLSVRHVQAEEYGSHDKTFVVPEAQFRV